MNELMNLTKGMWLVCLDDSINGIETNRPYLFLGYHDAIIPKNDLHATMSWYPSRPIWTPEEYEVIKFKFMMVNLEGLSKPVSLKYFQVYEFTD